MTPVALILAAFAVLAMFVTGTAIYARGWQQRLDMEALSRARGHMPVGGRIRGRVARLLRRTGPGRHLMSQLRSADLEHRTAEVVVGGALATTTMLLLLPGTVTAPIAALLVGATALGARTVLHRLQTRRREAIVAQLPDLARMLSNGVAAGLALPTALSRAAVELQEPARSTVRHLVEEITLGQPMDTALHNLRARVASRDAGVLVSTLVIQHRAGGDTVSALRGMSQTLEAREDLRREIRTMLAGVRATTYAVGGLGAGAVLLLNGIDDRVLPQLTGTTPGRVVLVLGFGLMGLGMAAIRRTTRVDL